MLGGLACFCSNLLHSSECISITSSSRVFGDVASPHSFRAGALQVISTQEIFFPKGISESEAPTRAGRRFKFSNARTFLGGNMLLL